MGVAVGQQAASKGTLRKSTKSAMRFSCHIDCRRIVGFTVITRRRFRDMFFKAYHCQAGRRVASLLAEIKSWN
jgi:hypothetical protein